MSPPPLTNRRHPDAQRWRFGRAIAAALMFLPSEALAGSSGHQSVIGNIALCMVAASALGVLMKLLRQPLLLGYLIAGVLIGPLGFAFVSDRSAIVEVAEIGLILLLFLIGLEIDLKKMLSAGRLVLVTGVLQFPLSVAIAYGLLWLAGRLGFAFGSGTYAVLYLAVAVSISSTMIVVKLLYDKLELDTLTGRITVGILVFQDIWAIIVLAVQPNLAKPELLGLFKTFGSGALLVVLALVSSRHLLPRVFHVVAKVPEMMVVVSLGWCFLVGIVAAHPAIGLSMEMGALIAGAALATFPYNLDVIAKVLSIRDFFITLFFVSLGMQIPKPELGVIAAALVVSFVLVAARIVGVFGILEMLKAGHRASTVVTVNLAQMSEFALVILTLGVGLGHIRADVLAIAIWTFALLAVASTYQIAASDWVQRLATRMLIRLGIRDVGGTVSEVRRVGERPVVLLGFYRIAAAFLEDVLRREQGMLEDLKVVDFNPEVRDKLTALGVPCVYGDISNPDTLHHAHVNAARVIISTVPDSALRGTSNLKLLAALRQHARNAKVIMTAETPEQAVALYAAGADFVVQPYATAGASLLTAVEQAMRGSCEGLKEEAESDLSSRTGRHEPIAASETRDGAS